MVELQHLGDDVYDDMTCHLAFNPTNTLITVGSCHGSSLLWDLHPHGKIQILGEQFIGDEYAVACTFSLDGKYLATSSSSVRDMYRIWEVSKAQVVESWKGSEGTDCLAWSPNTQYLAYGWERVYLWDLQARQEKSFGKSADGVLRICWSLSSQFVASGDYSGLTQVWDIITNDLIAETEICTSNIQGLKFLTDDLLLVLHATGLSKWNLATNSAESLYKFSNGEGGWPCCMSNDGRLIAYEDRFAVYVTDLSTGQRIWGFTPWDMDGCSSLAFSPDATKLAFGDWIGGLWVCDLDEEI